jgi:hypothetical protein
VASLITALVISYIESISDFSLWGWTVEWSYEQARDLADWLYAKID